MLFVFGVFLFYRQPSRSVFLLFGYRQPSRLVFLMFLMIFGDRRPSRFVLFVFLTFRVESAYGCRERLRVVFLSYSSQGLRERLRVSRAPWHRSRRTFAGPSWPMSSQTRLHRGFQCRNSKQSPIRNTQGLRTTVFEGSEPLPQGNRRVRTPPAPPDGPSRLTSNR